MSKSSANRPAFSHLVSRLDSEFSFSGDDDDDIVKPDAIHKAVALEPWYKVRL